MNSPNRSHKKLITILIHETLSLRSVLMIKYCTATYSAINLVLLLKTPGGSSFIWLLPKNLRDDIPRR